MSYFRNWAPSSLFNLTVAFYAIHAGLKFDRWMFSSLDGVGRLAHSTGRVREHFLAVHLTENNINILDFFILTLGCFYSQILVYPSKK